MLDDVIQSLKPKVHKCRYWDDIRDHAIASPSDIGIHNILRTSGGLFFLDFEYAGRDDLSKLAADIIVHPEYTLTGSKEKILLNKLQTNMRNIIPESWLLRLDDIKPLISIKWCLIMLRKSEENNLCENQLKKTMLYFKKM